MKKTGFLIVALGVSVLMGTFCSAEEMNGMQDKEPGMKKGMMMDKKMMMGKKMMMCPMMMKGMEKSVVATSDGGIVVLAGNHLAKYDKDLNLVRELDMKVDMEAMQKEMAGMMKMCSMMQGDMKEMESEPKEAEGGPAEEIKTASPDEHSAHH